LDYRDDGYGRFGKPPRKTTLLNPLMVYNADEIRPKISGGLSHGGLLYLGLASKNISVKFNCQNEQNNSSLEIIVKNKGYQSIRILLLKDCKNSLKSRQHESNQKIC